MPHQEAIHCFLFRIDLDHVYVWECTSVPHSLSLLSIPASFAHGNNFTTPVVYRSSRPIVFYYAIALFHRRNTKNTKDGTKGIGRVALDSLCHETLLPYPLPTACFFVLFVFDGSGVFFGFCGLCVLFSVSA